MRLLFLLVLGSVICAGQESRPSGEDKHSEHGGHHPPRSVEEWLERLESPERDSWQKPDDVVQALELRPGQTVADIGSGSGYFTVRFANAVGTSGKVFGVDVDEGLIEYLRDRAAKQDLPQIETIHGAPDDPKLEPDSVDLIFICNVVHHIENRPEYYSKLARALHSDGRLAIVDFYKRELPVGPSPGMKIARDHMIAELKQTGFALQKEFGFLPYQYFLVFKKAQS